MTIFSFNIFIQHYEYLSQLKVYRGGSVCNLIQCLNLYNRLIEREYSRVLERSASRRVRWSAARLRRWLGGASNEDRCYTRSKKLPNDGLKLCLIFKCPCAGRENLTKERTNNNGKTAPYTLPNNELFFTVITLIEVSCPSIVYI